MNTNFTNKLLLLGGILILSFMAALPVFAQDYICPTDNSNWGGDTAGCAAFCTVPCISEWQATHKECKNGACKSVPGPGVDLCQSDEAFCRGKFCRNNKCELILAPGPGGLSPAGQCKTDPECAPKVPPGGAATSVPPGGQTQPVPPGGGTGVEIPNPLGVGTFQALVERIARYLFQIGIPIAVIMILYSAFLYMTAGGDESKVTTAHKALTYALVGLAILFLAWGLTSLVAELLGGQTTSGPATQQDQDYQDYYQRQKQAPATQQDQDYQDYYQRQKQAPATQQDQNYQDYYQRQK